MFGSNEYWWAGLLVFFLFIGINVIIWALRKKPQLSYAIAYSIAIFLFIFKVTEYTYWQAIGLHMKFPMELSALSYVFFSIFVVFRIKKADVFGVFLGVLAGAIYSAAWWISPDSFVLNADEPFWRYSALVNHHLVYIGGMLMLANVRRYRYSSAWIHIVGVGAIVAYSWVIYLFTPYVRDNGGGKPIIIQITDGSVLENLFKNGITTTHTIIYYILAILLFLAIVFGSLFLNHLTTKRRVKNGLPEDFYPPFKEIYKIKSAK